MIILDLVAKSIKWATGLFSVGMAISVIHLRGLAESVGEEAVMRATSDGGGAALSPQDQLLWAAARQNYWSDILAVASDPKHLSKIAITAITISVLISIVAYMRSRERSISQGAANGLL
ncbi:MAG: hypothetical protein ORO03_01290 [Alphaproteobacteria bacterium]|nr:hypothetical protein [Alphaproteobacteria bacterium]